MSVEQADPKRISGVKIEAEMKTPTTVITLLPPPDPETDDEKEEDQHISEAQDNEGVRKEEKSDQRTPDILESTQSLQRIISYHLKEEGSHILAVTVTYNETGTISGRLRTFRKLYQFVAKPCMVVRTKTGALPDKVVGEKRKRKWAMEAQLENVGDDSILLENVFLEAKSSFKTTSLNWDMYRDDPKKEPQNPTLKTKEVQQVCFLVEENGDLEIEPGGRLMIGQLNIGWRAKMGDVGFLSTGWLGTRLR